MTQMTPQEIVSELDKHIIGQQDAKRAVAIALRNRWRRLHTVMEKLLEEISFTASDSPGRKVEIDAAYVRDKVGALAKNADLSKFVL